MSVGVPECRSHDESKNVNASNFQSQVLAWDKNSDVDIRQRALKGGSLQGHFGNVFFG